MITLSVDTSTFVGVAAVSDENKLISEVANVVHRSHSGSLLKMIDEALEKAKISLNDIDFFSVGAGPGSFTGLRIGLSTVKAFSKVTEKPIVPVSTLEALALNSNEKNIVSLLDSRRNEVYVRLNGKEFVTSPKDLALQLAHEEFILIGNSVHTYENVWSEHSNLKFFNDEKMNIINGHNIARLGFREYDNFKNKKYHEILPNYIAQGPVKE